MGSNDRGVAVTFIDEATGEAFATLDLSPDDLPESFAFETTLHLGDDEWTVVEARPQTRPEYAESRSLVLRLRRVERLDPQNILFSLPSVCDRLPPIGEGKLASDECLLHEDEWRQLEFVSRRFASEVAAEIAAIRRIHEEASAGVGWREIHVRRCLHPPVDGAFTIERIGEALGGSASFRGVGFHGAPAPVASGFSFQAEDGVEGYGLVHDGRVIVLAIVPGVMSPPPHRSADALAELARAFDLELVDWCRCLRATWDEPDFRRMLVGLGP